MTSMDKDTDFQIQCKSYATW